MLQLWNLFNAKMFPSSESLLKGFSSNKAFIAIVIFIFILQVVLVEVGGELMRTTHIGVYNWIITIFATGVLILGGGKIVRVFNKR